MSDTTRYVRSGAGDFQRWLGSVRVPHGNKVYLQDRAYPAIDDLRSNLDMLPAAITSVRQWTDVVRDLGIGADWFNAEDVATMLWTVTLRGGRDESGRSTLFGQSHAWIATMEEIAKATS
jgi:hypothetical protein